MKDVSELELDCSDCLSVWYSYDLILIVDTITVCLLKNKDAKSKSRPVMFCFVFVDILDILKTLPDVQSLLTYLNYLLQAS